MVGLSYRQREISCLVFNILLVFNCINHVDSRKFYQVGLNRIMCTVLRNCEIIARLRIFNPSNPVIKFMAFGNSFEIRLFRDTTTLSGVKIVIDGDDTHSSLNKAIFYRGRLILNDILVDANVFGTLARGRFLGMIRTKQDTYHMEALNKYITGQTGTLLYKESDQFSDNLVHTTMLDNAEGDPSDSDSSIDILSNGINKHRYRREKQKLIMKKYGKSDPVSCTLKLVADHRFFQQVGGGSVTQTIQELVIRYQIVDAILRGTDFNQDGVGDNFGLHLKAIHVEKDGKRKGYLFETIENLSDGLAKFTSDGGNEDFCIAYVFTSTHLKDKVAGRAFRPLLSAGHRATGGVCGIGKNTGILTAAIDGRIEPIYSSARIFLHEFGHSLGSGHDEDTGNPSCAPVDGTGKYVMSKFYSPKNFPNSIKFSTCSKASILPILAKNGRVCFEYHSVNSICGNIIIEGDEVCDCGSISICDEVDRCCTPSNAWNGTTVPCALRKSSVCSPIVSKCCSIDCQIEREGTVCSKETDCSEESKCSGSTECPTPKAKPDGILCSSGLYCRDGLCVDSVCVVNGLKDCQCPDDSTCYRCCSHDGSCFYAYQLELVNIDDMSKYIGFGGLCNNNNGYCGQNHKCYGEVHLEDVDIIDLFDEDSLQDSAKWLSANWYYVIMVLLFFGFTGHLIRLFCLNKHEQDAKAKSIGRLLALRNHIDVELKIVHDRAKKLISVLDKHIREDVFNKQRTLTQAVLRLLVLFPDITVEQIRRIVVISSCEDFAVKMLIIQGFKITKLFRKDDPNIFKINIIIEKTDTDTRNDNKSEGDAEQGGQQGMDRSHSITFGMATDPNLLSVDEARSFRSDNQ